MFALNYVPVLALLLILYFLINRGWIAFLITACIGFLMVFVNYYKVLFRAESFVALDLTTLSEGAEAGGAFRFVFPAAFWLGLVLIFGLTYLLYRYGQMKIARSFLWLRPLGILACFGLMQILWNPCYGDLKYYHGFSPNDLSVFNDWKEPEFTAKRGFVYSFLFSVNDLFMPEPENYDPQAIQARLDQYTTQAIPPEERVNVVFHMLESFSDLSELGIRFQGDPYAEWHSLEEESYHGTLLVDTVGGGTTNAERSAMTGFTYIHPDYDIPTNSYIRYFAWNGYFTDAAHPGSDWFYNRAAIDRRIGFQRTLFNQNYFKDIPDAPFGADGVVLPAFREIYREKAAQEQPYFGFYVNYQNHSPYESGSLLGQEFLSRESLSEENYYTMNNYLSGVSDTGKQLLSYVESYRADSEPVILVFFGDHKPVLGEANSAYEELGINVSGQSTEGSYNLYSTPYLIWANDAAKEIFGDVFCGQGPTISPCYLMNELFDLCGWAGPQWLQYQSEVKQTLPVLQRRKWSLVDGCLTDELTEEQIRVRLERNRVEFYVRYNLFEEYQ